MKQLIEKIDAQIEESKQEYAQLDFQIAPRTAMHLGGFIDGLSYARKLMSDAQYETGESIETAYLNGVIRDIAGKYEELARMAERLKCQIG